MNARNRGRSDPAAPAAFSLRADCAAALDAADGLAELRGAFRHPRQGRRRLVYLCGQSLGLMPRGARAAVLAELERWAKRGVEGHFDGSDGWFDYHERFSAPLAALAGARPADVVAMNTLTVNLHLMMASFYRPTRQRAGILIERGAFPSDRYAVESQLRHHGLDPGRSLIELAPAGTPPGIDPDALDTTLARARGRVALVLLPGVQYATGQAVDIARCTEVAHRHGCLIGFDLAHAIGNLPLSLDRAGADFAVWCSYKYLNGGPGAVAGCFVHRRWADDPDLPRLAGWWGHDRSRRFSADAPFAPIPGAQGWQLSNPPVLSLAPLAASLELFTRAGMPALRQKSQRLTAYLDFLLSQGLGDSVEILTPRDAAARGCQLSVRIAARHASGGELAARLRGAGIVADWRGADVLRLAPVPLYNSFRDVYRAWRALARALGR